METYSENWIRIAGNIMNIKAGKQTMHWRCYVGRAQPLIPLSDYRLRGTISPCNFIPGTAPDTDELGLHAWLDVFGILSVDTETGIAQIEMKEP